jgi:hypothetical protein
MLQSGMGNFTWGYFGGLMDAATGLLYVGNGQYYDPATGRFLTPANQKSPNPYLPMHFDPMGALLGPVAIVAWWRGRKRGRNGKADAWMVLMVVVLVLGVSQLACEQSANCCTDTAPASTTSSKTKDVFVKSTKLLWKCFWVK